MARLLYRQRSHTAVLLLLSTLVAVLSPVTDASTSVVVGFTAPVFPVEEGNGTAIVCISTDSALVEEVSVEVIAFEIASENASAFADFIPSAQNVTLPVSENFSTTCVNFEILDDRLALEGDEQFGVRFTLLAGLYDVRLEVGIQEAIVVISDDDIVSVDFTSMQFPVAEEDREVKVCVKTDLATATPLNVSVVTMETSPPEATAFEDFTPASRLITLPPTADSNGSVACTTFDILEDKIAFEGGERISVVIVLPSGNATQLGDNSTAWVVINDNDAVTLTYTIPSRPMARRPIPEERVVYMCEVEGATLTWTNPLFQDLTFVNALHETGENFTDDAAGIVAVLTSKAGNRLTSTLTFSGMGVAFNNTAIMCTDVMAASNSENIYLAGIPSPPVDPAQFNSTCTCANVTWGLPEFDGTADVLQFIIAFTLPNSTTLINSTPVTVVQTALGNETKIDICGLVPNVVYDTMIISSNAVGNSSAVSFMMLIEAIEPLPAVNLDVQRNCLDPSLCFSGLVQITWESPPENSALLCPVELVWVNYTIVELEVLVNASQVSLHPSQSSFTISPITPGTSYTVNVSFVNEVGESLNNPTEREDVLIFQSFLLQKRSSPGYITEGSQSVYSVKLNGPPPSNVAIELNASDQLTRILTSPLIFNSSNWYMEQDIYVMAVDDDVILESPYGSIVAMTTDSSREAYLKASNLTLLVTDADEVGVLIVPKEMYPYPPDIPEGRWAVYEVTLPNRPRFPVTVTYHTITDTIALSHPHMTFVPDVWNIPQDLTVYALEDAINTRSPYAAAFNLSLSSLDRNYNGPLPNFNVTVEDNDEDGAVLSGTLVWKSARAVSRTAAQLTLTLTLSLEHTPTNVTVGDEVQWPGKLKFGDGNEAEGGVMKVLFISPSEGYLVATASLLHRYPTANHYGNPWWAEFEYCCRRKNLVNNRGTMLALSVTVDLTYDSSPTLPILPTITLPSSPTTPGFFFTATHPTANPLIYSFGNSQDYRSTQAGTPRGLSVSTTTGHVTWDPAYFSPGDYSMQLVVVDVFTGSRVASELLIRVPSTTPSIPPTLPTPGMRLIHLAH